MGQPGQQPYDPRGALVRPYAVTRGRTEPQREDAWRQRSHAEWREFVERAGAL